MRSWSVEKISANRQNCDVLIVGGGVAGLSLALQLPEHLSIYLLSKQDDIHSNSYLAQGGISAAVGDDDSIDSHVEDTLRSGAGLCDPDVVRAVAEAAPTIIQWLQEIGVQFSTSGRHNQSSQGNRGNQSSQDSPGNRDNRDSPGNRDNRDSPGNRDNRDSPGNRDNLLLAHEGGHSRRRIVHSRDSTGRTVINAMLEQIKKRPHIKQIRNTIAIDLVLKENQGRSAQCLGLHALNTQTQDIITYTAQATVLATGGLGKVYLYTSNSEGASGDGVAMAWRAGCRVANLEFIQFHPTCLYHPQARSVLLSETLRGEGAKLLRVDGSQFMQAYDARGELATRDVIARALDLEMKKTGADYVHLDISGRPLDFYQQHFPSIYQQCKRYGYDLAQAPVPVVPAAHYACGGVVADLNGCTELDRLYVIGEAACTGMHGANRIASNSLLECVVQAQRAGAHIAHRMQQSSFIEQVATWDDSRVDVAAEKVTISHNWDMVRRLMWNYVGIARACKRLQLAQNHIRVLFADVQNYYACHHISSDLIELRNLVVIANLIVCSALARRESRGLHQVQDYPQTETSLAGKSTILLPQRGDVMAIKEVRLEALRIL